MISKGKNLSVFLFVACVIGTCFGSAVIWADHDDDIGQKSKPKTVVTPGRVRSSQCDVDPESMNEFANGEAYDFRSMVTYLTSPGCIENGRLAAQTAMSRGVKFGTVGPIKLDNFAKAISYEDLTGQKRTESLVAAQIPSLLRDNPMSTPELMPVVGQLALLSPPAARYSLVTLIQQELFTADGLYVASKSDAERAATAGLIASTLSRMGAKEPLIATELAARVEDMAEQVQADSLGKIFRTMGAATSVDPELANVFNLSAGAFNRGVQKAKGLYNPSDRNNLLKAVFVAVQAATGGSEALEPGALELNEGVASLMDGAPLKTTSLKQVWNEVIRILGHTSTQSTLAEAVSLSLTPEFVYLPVASRAQLMDAAKNYSSLALSVQANFLEAFQAAIDQKKQGMINQAHWNQLQTRYFGPIVATLLEFNPDRIEYHWLRTVWKENLIQDGDLEKRFPRQVVAYLDRREKAMKRALRAQDLESGLSLMAENFGTLYTLSSVHIPALMDWVKRYDNH